MSTSYASALEAARQVASGQDYPQGCLYVVATPIGNLADMSLRALHVLQIADTLACEDTRHSQQLLRAYGIDKRPAQWLAVHQHNEAEASEAVLKRLQAGERVVYMSDAGTPAVSDPGARLVAAAHAAGLRTIPLPGASSITAALSVAGAIAPTGVSGGFVFVGFLPTKGGERAQAVQELADDPRCAVLLEAPHRIQALAQALAVLDERPVTLAREISKQFEQVTTLPARQLAAWLDEAPQRSKGEFVVVVHPRAQARHAAGDEKVLRLLMEELPVKTAVRIASALCPTPRNELYDLALTLRRQAQEEAEDDDAENA